MHKSVQEDHHNPQLCQTGSKGSVLRLCESVGSGSLQCRELPDQRREVASYAPGYVLWVLQSYVPWGSAGAGRALGCVPWAITAIWFSSYSRW